MTHAIYSKTHSNITLSPQTVILPCHRCVLHSKVLIELNKCAREMQHQAQEALKSCVALWSCMED